MGSQIMSICLSTPFCERYPYFLWDCTGLFLVSVMCSPLFEVVQGLKINLDKSELVHVGNVLNVSGLARILGCRVLSFPLKYLGLPLSAQFKAKFIWDTIIEKIERRLVSRKRLYLSNGCQLMLIKSTLSNLSTYFLSLFSLLVGVSNQIEKL
jgi:hypothetical protein